MSHVHAKAHRSWPQRLVIVLGLVVSVVAMVSAAGIGYFNAKASEVQRVSLTGVLSDPDATPGASQNFLIVGTDSDTGLDANDPATHGRGQVTGARSDTIMILNVNPKEKSASLLSLPRDLWVEIAGEGTHQRLNTAVGLGGDGVAGPAKLIETIQQNFQIPIHHYVEINFHGFEKIVDTLNGIPVYFQTGIRDRDGDGVPHTILNITEPGCYTLDSAHALAYARARYVQFQTVPGDNSSWQSDPTADLGRINRQQDFVKRVLRRAIDKGITDPVSMNRMIDTGLASIQVDKNLTAGDIVALGRRFRNFNPEELKTYQLPVYGAWAGDASVVKLRQPEAEAMLAKFRDVPSTGSTNTSGIAVQVFNGTGRTNEATLVSEALTKVGFSTARPSDQLGVTDEASIIRFQAGQEADAGLLARHVQSKVIFEQVETPRWQETTPPIQFITGTSYTGVLATPRDDVAVPVPSTTTTSTTTTVVGSDQPTSSASTSTSTTTLPGFVVGDPPDGTKCG